MSQIILDEHLGRNQALHPIQHWITAKRIQDLRPGEVIKDERLPTILIHLIKPTLVTIDAGLWKKRYCDRRYCILYFAILDIQQNQIPALLRRVLRLKDFKTKAARMGKVARVTFTHVSYWQLGDEKPHTVPLPS
jgi:hypothetical protein